MKKSAKPLILLTLFYMITITLFILGYVGIKLKCEEMTKQKILAKQELENIENWKLSLSAQRQSLTAEDRIVPIAEEELGMIKSADAPVILTVDKNEIEKISKIVKGKYE
jgi:cell division protein FtsL